MKLPNLTVIGGGQMARALVGGMFSQNVIAPSQTQIVAPSQATRDWWKNRFPEVRVTDKAASAIVDCEIVLLAVKPHVIPFVLNNPHCDFAGKLVVSIAAGVPMSKLTAGTGHQRVIRVMPNTPSLVAAGASAFCADDGVTSADIEHVTAMLSSVGYVTRVSEDQLNAVTGLSGSGPAYVFLIIEALADGGVLAGLPRKVALELAAQTVLGAAKMVQESGDHPGVLKDNVCSPGGTTIAAVRVLEQNGVRGALIDAVKASADRGHELSRQS